MRDVAVGRPYDRHGSVRKRSGFVQGVRGRNGRLDALAGRSSGCRCADARRHSCGAASRPGRRWRCQGAVARVSLRPVGRRPPEALDDRATFRRFCGFSSSEAVPERTACACGVSGGARARRAAVPGGAADRGAGAGGETGTLVDATVVRQAARTDGEAELVRLRRHAAHAGQGLQGACRGRRGRRHRAEGGGDAGERCTTARASRRCCRPRPGRVWADSAYDQWTRPARARARRGVPRTPAGSTRA